MAIELPKSSKSACYSRCFLGVGMDGLEINKTNDVTMEVDLQQDDDDSGGGMEVGMDTGMMNVDVDGPDECRNDVFVDDV